jgi:hypothetical protein
MNEYANEGWLHSLSLSVSKTAFVGARYTASRYVLLTSHQYEGSKKIGEKEIRCINR